MAYPYDKMTSKTGREIQCRVKMPNNISSDDSQPLLTLYLDESGYTGPDLVSINQPTFVIATTNLHEVECQELKTRFFGSINASELKHSSLQSRSSQQQMVFEFLNYVVEHEFNFRVAAVHKRYALLAKSVDLVVETAAFETGFNFYQDGLNIAFTNLCWNVLPILSGETFFVDFLTRFQNMCRNRSRLGYDVFFDLVLSPQAHTEADGIMDYFRLAHHTHGYDLLDTLPADPLDIVYTITLMHMGRWRADVSSPMGLIHDQSSNMKRQKNIWDAMVSADMPPAEFRNGTKTVKFPIALKSTRFEDSKRWAGLQLTDVLAGAVARVARWMTLGKPDSDIYAQSIVDLVLSIQMDPFLWPSTDVAQTSFKTSNRNTDESLEYFMNFYRSHDEDQ